MAAFLGTLLKGPRFAFAWVYLPALLLVPLQASLNIVGLPELTVRRAAIVGLAAGALAAGRFVQRLPRWHPIDYIVCAAILSFSISFGLRTELMGFVHKVAVLAFDWGAPYLLARTLLSSWRDVRAVLLPLAGAGVVLACFAVYEARMATRLASDLWELVGVDAPRHSHMLGWRWGYLRAHAVMDGPIQMGTVFAALTPLMMLWGLLDRRRRERSWLAAAATAAGCIASLSRGPILVLTATAAFFSALALRLRAPWLLGALLLPFAAPVAIAALGERIDFTEQMLAETGNTATFSGHYRIALLLIYGRQIGEVGWWGDPSVVGQDYEQAWSIDNSYLFLFIIGGWIGGALISALIVYLLVRGVRAVMRARGRERRVLAACTASFTAVIGCMGNVWFSPSYVPLFWLSAGLLLNATAPRARRRRPRARVAREAVGAVAG